MPITAEKTRERTQDRLVDILTYNSRIAKLLKENFCNVRIDDRNPDDYGSFYIAGHMLESDLPIKTLNSLVETAKDADITQFGGYEIVAHITREPISSYRSFTEDRLWKERTI